MIKNAMKLFVFPGNIEPEILSIGSGQVPYARTQAFGDLVLSCEKDLLRLLGCSSGRVIPFTASGTGAMEAAVANLVGENDRVLVLSGGNFGERWAELVRRYPHSRLDVDEIGYQPDYEKLERRIRDGGYRAVLMQHHETSTGALYDVARIGSVCREVGSLCVVDAIGSFLADPFCMDEMHVDVAILSSQKGLCLPPGLSFVALNEIARAAIHGHGGLYFDFISNLGSLDRGQPLFSPPSLLYLQLRKRLDSIPSPDVVIRQVAAKARAFRRCLEADRRAMIPSVASSCLTSFRVSGDARSLCLTLEGEGWYILPSKEPDQIRVAHLGATTELDHQTLYGKLLKLENK